MTEPALTPEEWKAVGLGEIEASAGLYLNEEDCNDVLTWWDRKRVAAVCLYGQPFGFTREDVLLLRNSADLFDGYVLSQNFHELADRIEALLPPVDSVTPQP